MIGLQVSIEVEGKEYPLAMWGKELYAIIGEDKWNGRQTFKIQKVTKKMKLDFRSSIINHVSGRELKPPIL